MNFKLFSTFRNYDIKNLHKDLLTGIIIMAVSIPISMGYAQISGLPAIYGLYGSVFPILIFAIFSSSPQFIFGVDAAPAALVGASLLTLGIEADTPETLGIVPVITFFTAVWLFIFFLFGAGKLVNYISTPVMGGFISGICMTIILMQLPKFLGGSAGTGESVELLTHIYKCLKHINITSLVLGLGTLLILQLSKRIAPKFPMAIVVMIAGAVSSWKFHIQDRGVALLSAVSPGMPKFAFPNLSLITINITEIATLSLSIAIVIMAETLLSENNFALKNNYKLNDNQEILAFSLGNLMASFTGCCPINGSVSRTTMGEQYGGKTQLTSIVAGISMICVLLFGTGFIKYLPVPILTAIVISALMGAVEFHLAKKLWKVSRSEFYIFCAAFLGVLLLGTVFGVLIGIVLSFVAVVLKAADPPRGFLGMLPGHDEFYDISQFKHTYPIEHIVIYRFNSNLFFANINIFQTDIENSIKDDTQAVIIDASGINTMDITAAERLEIIYKNMKTQGIRFYITEHIANLNDQMRILGIDYMIREGAVRRTINAALGDMGLKKPYPLVGTHNLHTSLKRKRAQNTAQEFIWAYGKNAEAEIEKQIVLKIEEMRKTGDMDILFHSSWNKLGFLDEDVWLEHLEEHINEIARISGQKEENVVQSFEQRRSRIAARITKDHPELAKTFMERRVILDEHLKEHHPDVYKNIIKFRKNADKAE